MLNGKDDQTANGPQPGAAEDWDDGMTMISEVCGVRVTKTLAHYGILTMEALILRDFRDSEILQMPNLGRKSLNEIKHAIREYKKTRGIPQPLMVGESPAFRWPCQMTATVA